MIKKVQPLSREQLVKFEETLAGDFTFALGRGNNRVTQPVNDRTLYQTSEASLGFNLFSGVN